MGPLLLMFFGNWTMCLLSLWCPEIQTQSDDLMSSNPSWPLAVDFYNYHVKVPHFPRRLKRVLLFS